MEGRTPFPIQTLVSVATQNVLQSIVIPSIKNWWEQKQVRKGQQNHPDTAGQIIHRSRDKLRSDDQKGAEDALEEAKWGAPWGAVGHLGPQSIGKWQAILE